MKKDCRGEDHMSRLEIMSPTRARIVMEGLYKDLERRIESSPPGLCPVDMARAFLEPGYTGITKPVSFYIFSIPGGYYECNLHPGN